ncbi:hypothetical protein BCR33DRAFT_37115 [Rhizoclosmatium globosum]|uniref:Ubiquitin-like domain-containing protein n=1 Tax=Rhizoclosmatium globosum TaxID=329046 RepID=A0A1Y2CN98_9FUNG|nr:hypothetical protein BCR33DRAFT_37115 [Rhizoclosmatium globosum]|eukprot:ORY48510.1 hypothetical protein BCR33DRAFT_37115 [Rhizoclosmatium globosum]
MSHHDWIPSPALALAIFEASDAAPNVMEKQAIIKTSFNTRLTQVLAFFVKLLDGKHLFVEIRQDATVLELRNYLVQSRNVANAFSLQLVFGGQYMDDSHLLSSYNLVVDSTIRFVGKLPGGADNMYSSTDPSQKVGSSSTDASPVESQEPPSVPLRDESNELPSLSGSSVGGSSVPSFSPIQPYSRRGRRPFHYSRQSSTTDSDLNVGDSSATISRGDYLDVAATPTPKNLNQIDYQSDEETTVPLRSNMLATSGAVESGTSSISVLTASPLPEYAPFEMSGFDATFIPSALSQTVEAESGLASTLSAPPAQISEYVSFIVSDSETESEPSTCNNSDPESLADGEVIS